MITKERLEELIEKGNMIWDKNILAINLMNFEQKYNDGFYAHKTYIKNNHLICEVIGDYDFTHTYSFEDLFETKEDAEEYAEFGNITRTERLELPTWASIEKDFDKFTNGSYVLVERDEFLLELKVLQYFPTQIVLLTDTEKFGWNLSRENYNYARRLCVKLFKGEE